MTPDQGETLSAFVDGVAVDPDRLAEALGGPDATAWLVACARLRADISDDGSRPSPAFYERMHAALRPRGLRWLVRAAAVALPWPVAAGAAVATLAGGLWAGLWLGAGPTPAEPPAVTVTAPVTPGAVLPAPATQPPSPGTAPQVGPPQPTQVLRFGTPGEWREGL
jgi:hypothetical protein